MELLEYFVFGCPRTKVQRKVGLLRVWVREIGWGLLASTTQTAATSLLLHKENYLSLQCVLLVVAKLAQG